MHWASLILCLNLLLAAGLVVRAFGGGGLTPARNAPTAGPVPVPGVQPGNQPQVVTSRLIIVGSGGSQLVYSPSAAAGNLIFSVAGKPGTDPFMDALLAGAASYSQISGILFRAVALQGGGIQFYSASSAAGPWTSLGSITVDASGNMLLTAAGNLFFNGTQITVP